MTQSQDFGDDLVVIPIVAVVAPTIVVSPDLLSQVPLIGESKERVHRRARVGDGPAPLLASAGCGPGGSGDHVGREAPKLVLFKEDHIRLFIVQHVFTKRGVELGESTLDGRVALPVLSAKGGPSSCEVVVGRLQQTLFRRT